MTCRPTFSKVSTISMYHLIVRFGSSVGQPPFRSIDQFLRAEKQISD